MAALMRRFNVIFRDYHASIYNRSLGRFSSISNEQKTDVSTSKDTRVQQKSPYFDRPKIVFKRTRRYEHTPDNDSKPKLVAPPEYRYIYPEFLPDLGPEFRHHIREKIERKDMLNRRKSIHIPEFHVGSIIAVTASDLCAPRKENRFVGIVIHRDGYGMRATFHVRNVVDHQGVEIKYDLYNPSLRKIEVLKLEKRLDSSLFYLRDALPEYSTFPFDMVPVPHPEGQPAPINPLKVKLKPRPWYRKWHQKDILGIQDSDRIQPRLYFETKKYIQTPWEKYDLMKQYRSLITEEEQQEIYADVHEHKKYFEKTQRKVKKTFLYSSFPSKTQT